MIIAPPLSTCTGAMDIAPVHGGFGTGSGAMLWRGACYGCGAEVACRPDYPQPECTGCGRRRHGIVDTPRRRGTIPPAVAIVREKPRAPLPVSVTTAPPSSITVLRRSASIALTDPALPGAVRRLAESATAAGWSATLTAAVAADDKGVLATVALRVQGLGYAVYRRRDDGWDFDRAVLADPQLRRANVGQFTAALARVEYVPPPPKSPPAQGTCPSCGGEVSLTKAGAVYASHRCKTTNTEGRS